MSVRVCYMSKCINAVIEWSTCVYVVGVFMFVYVRAFVCLYVLNIYIYIHIYIACKQETRNQKHKIAP